MRSMSNDESKNHGAERLQKLKEMQYRNQDMLRVHSDAARASMIIPAPLRAGVADLVTAVHMLTVRCELLEDELQRVRDELQLVREDFKAPCEGCGGTRRPAPGAAVLADESGLPLLVAAEGGV